MRPYGLKIRTCDAFEYHSSLPRICSSGDPGVDFRSQLSRYTPACDAVLLVFLSFYTRPSTPSNHSKTFEKALQATLTPQKSGKWGPRLNGEEDIENVYRPGVGYIEPLGGAFGIKVSLGFRVWGKYIWEQLNRLTLLKVVELRKA